MNTPEALRGQRRNSGSYYTPVELVDLVLAEALQPLIDEASDAPDPEQALLALTVCDPSCGAGVFLVQALRRLGAALAGHRCGGMPSRWEIARAKRDLVGQIYGVDLNPVAVELTRLLLSAEVVAPGQLNPDLRGQIKHGNALLGTTPALLAKGIPDVAYQPLTGDDPQVAREWRDRNRRERKYAGLPPFSGKTPAPAPPPVATASATIEERTAELVAAVAERERAGVTWTPWAFSSDFAAVVRRQAGAVDLEVLGNTRDDGWYWRAAVGLDHLRHEQAGTALDALLMAERAAAERGTG